MTPYQRFVASLSVHDPESAHSIDLDALAALQGSERAEAERLLLERLAGGDPRAPLALTRIDSDAARAALEQAEEHGDERVRAETAAALVGSDPDPARIDRLMRLAEGAADGEARLTAAIALRRQDNPMVTETFHKLLADASWPVRSHALDELLRRHKLDGNRPGTALAALGLGLSSRSAVRREQAKKALQQTFDALDDGTSPEVLGIAGGPESAALARFLRSYRGDGEIDTVALMELQGEERQWAMHALLQRVEDGGEARAVRALGVLPTPFVHEVLRDLLPSLPPEAAGEARRVLG